ncbi:hypothetical protein NHQ30_003114 [Ciborinia camelliae]|nr:hypothetical protein NHQ30_003114 [Ciborinia camelliae]
MSSTQAPNSSPASSQKKAADNKCVQTTKGWVCALCFPLGDPNRALERVLNLSELKLHAAGNHYASLGQNEWENYVNKSVYYEAQFKGQNSLGLDGGVMRGPPTVASQKTLSKQAGVPKRKYVRKTKPVAKESALDLMERMINFDGNADDHVMSEAPDSPGGSQDEDSEMSDVDFSPINPKTGNDSFFGLSAAHHQYGMHPMGVPQVAASPASRRSSTDPFYGQFDAQNQYGMHSVGGSQISATPTTPQSGRGSYYDPSAQYQFDMHSMDVSQAVASPSTPSRKKSSASKNPLRQRLSENPSFESAVSVHGLAKVRAAGNAGLQRYLDRQARGLPRTANANLPLNISPSRNGTLGLPLSAANYAAAGMPNIQVEKPARRAKKVDRRRQASTTLSIADGAERNTSPSTNAVPTNLTLNQFGLPATIFGQAPGAVYKSHTYNSIYAEKTPNEQRPLPGLSFPHIPLPEIPSDLFLPEIPSELSLPEFSLPEFSLPEFSLPEFSLPEFSLPVTNNKVVQQEPTGNVGTVGIFSDDQVTGLTEDFITDFFNEDFAPANGISQTGVGRSHRDIFGTPEPNQSFNGMGIDGTFDDSFDFFAAHDYSFDQDTTFNHPVPVPQQDNGVLEKFLASIPKQTDSEIDAMFGFGNPSTSTNTNNNFSVFNTTSLEYGIGLQTLETVQGIVSAVGRSSPAHSTASSHVVEPSSPAHSTASSQVVEPSSTVVEPSSPAHSTASHVVEPSSTAVEPSSTDDSSDCSPVGDSSTSTTRASSTAVEAALPNFEDPPATLAPSSTFAEDPSVFDGIMPPLESPLPESIAATEPHFPESPVTVKSPVALESLPAVELAAPLTAAVPAIVTPEMNALFKQFMEQQFAEHQKKLEQEQKQKKSLDKQLLEQQMAANEALVKRIEDQDAKIEKMARRDAVHSAKAAATAKADELRRVEAHRNRLSKKSNEELSGVVPGRTTGKGNPTVAAKDNTRQLPVVSKKQVLVPREPFGPFVPAYYQKKTKEPAVAPKSAPAARPVRTVPAPRAASRARPAASAPPSGVEKKNRAKGAMKHSAWEAKVLASDDVMLNVKDRDGNWVFVKKADLGKLKPTSVEKEETRMPVAKKPANQSYVNSLGIQGFTRDPLIPRTNRPKPSHS